MSETNRIFVGGMSNMVTYAQLENALAKFGHVEEMTIVVNKQNESRVFAFVTMRTVAEARRCTDRRPLSGICYAFERGECMRGDTCWNLHIKKERNIECYEYRMGRCTAGNTSQTSKMDRTIEFVAATESFGYSGSHSKALPPSGFVLKAANMFTQIAMFENLINNLSSSYIGYNRFLPSTTISSPLTAEERRNMNKEILLFIGNISAEMKELNRFLERTSDDSVQYYHNKQVVSTLVVKLQSFMVANDKMQKLHKQNNISPFRLMTETKEDERKAGKDEYFGSSSSAVDKNSISSSNGTTPAGESNAKSGGFSGRYVDEIASQSKMNEYKSIAAKHKASLLKEAKVLQTRFNDDLEESIRMEQEVNNISKLLAQFVVMLDSQSEIVTDVHKFSKQSTLTVKQAGEQLQLTLDRTQSHQWSMVILILGFAVLLLVLDYLS